MHQPIQHIISSFVKTIIMKTFYSILSAVINPISGEKISLGLLLSDGNSSLFDYSNNRLSMISSVLNHENKRFIRQYIQSIEIVLNKIDVNQEQISILNNEGKNVILNESYVEYLSIYNKNVISFSKPVSINVEVNEFTFNTLFAKFIDEDAIVAEQTIKPIKIVKDEFSSKVKSYFTIEKEFTINQFSQLFLPVTIDLYGKNERFVFGQFLDLEKAVNHIKSDYFDFDQIITVHPKNSQKYLISSEPNKDKFQIQHKFWQEIRKSKQQEFVDISEIERIQDYAKLHGVVPVE